MSGNALFGDPVHFLGTDLHLKCLSSISDHGRVQGLIQVVPWNGDPVLESLGNRRPNIVNDAQGQIAILPVIFRNDPRRDQVVNLLDHEFLLFKFLPK